MSKKKSISIPPEEEFFDNVFEDHDFEDEGVINTFHQVAEASVEHMKVACDLTKMIVDAHKNEKLSVDEILEIFRKSAHTILDCTPLKALFEEKT